MKTPLLLFLLLTYCWGASAQIPGEPRTVQAPNAASLGQYGEVPVSLFTGLPSVDIPLYTVQEGKITVPISLSYHASGFRPDVHPGWVGMGWNLNAGGVITRTVHDLVDEYDNSSNSYRESSTVRYQGYFFNRVLNRSDWSTTSYLETVARSLIAPNSTTPSLPATSPAKDTEPDEFAFNFNGYSGKFYLHANGQWKVRCNKPITVTPTTSGLASSFLTAPFPVLPNSQVALEGASPTFAGFTITTEDGTKYVFGGTTSAIEYGLGMFTQNNEEWIANSWYLTKIIDSNNRQVLFTYTRDSGKYIAQMYLSLTNTLDIKAIEQGTTLPTRCYDEKSDATLNSGYSGKLISPVYLSTIQTTYGIISFETSSSTELTYPPSVFSLKVAGGAAGGMKDEALVYLRQGIPSDKMSLAACLANLEWKKLTAIRIKSALNTTQSLKSFVFTYNNDETPSNDLNERLTLLQVTEQGNGLGKPPYRFGYNKYHNLPIYLTDQVDHWGFYNANYISFTSSINYNTYYAHREANTDSAVYLAGILKRVVYPTGGVTDYQYEQHSFSKQLKEDRFTTLDIMNTNSSAGGVRIKRITSYSLDKPQEKLEREYIYATGYTPGLTTTAIAALTSSGVLGGRVRYLFPDYRAKAWNANMTYSRSIFSNQSVLPACSNSQGSHIGYTTVVEKRSDASYTQYSYSNFDTGNVDEPPLSILQAATQNNRTLYSPYTTTDEERGKLKQEIQFNSSGKPVLQRTLEYIAKNKSSEYVPVMQASQFAGCGGDGKLFDDGTTYKFYTYSYLPEREEVIVYDTQGNNPLTTRTSYIYNDQRLVQTETSTDSKNQTLLREYKYPFDFLPFPTNPSDESIRGIKSLVEQNIVGAPVQTVQSRNGRIISSALNTHRFFGSLLLPFKVYNLELSQALPSGSVVWADFNSATGPPVIDSRFSLKATFSRYDAQGNVLGVEQAGNQRNCYLWGYANTLPVAKVTNATTNEVFYEGFESAANWSNAPLVSNNPHTGTMGTFIDASYAGAQIHAFNNTPLSLTLTAPKKLTFSAWVYTEGPTGQLWLMLQRPSETGLYDGIAVSAVTTEPQQVGKWVYIENTVEVPADVVRVVVRLTGWCRGVNTPGKVFFDDIRVHPAEAQMTTYTHEPLIGVTSMADANSSPTYYFYDGLQRVQVIKDSKGNILKKYEYQYRQP